MTTVIGPAEARSAILAEVDALLATEAGWCQRAPARDASGKAVDTMSDSATSFCLYSALWRSAFVTDPSLETTSAAVKGLISDIHAAIDDSSILGWNDFHGRRFADVRELIGKLRS